MTNYTADKIQKYHDEYKEKIAVIKAMMGLTSDEVKKREQQRIIEEYNRFMSILKDIQHPF